MSNPVSGRLHRYAALLAVATQCVLASHAHSATASEYEVKAAFIYNFTKFVQWPATDTSRPLVIGVIGNDPFGPALDEAVKDKSVGGRALTVRRFSRIENVTECDVLFVASSEEPKLEQILKVLHNAPVLTVGDMEDFAEHGGMINLTTDGNRVRFEINLQAIERAGLKASSQLLRLGTIVTESR